MKIKWERIIGLMIMAVMLSAAIYFNNYLTTGGLVFGSTLLYFLFMYYYESKKYQETKRTEQAKEFLEIDNRKERQTYFIYIFLISLLFTFVALVLQYILHLLR